jgi:hypothetical protein
VITERGALLSVRFALTKFRPTTLPATLVTRPTLHERLTAGAVVQFMLDTAVLGELTVDACATVTGRQDTAVLLRSIDAANLFMVALDDERTSFRYHHLVRQVLRAELRARDRAHELAVQSRAAEWFESVGDTRRATRHFLAAQQVDRALALSVVRESRGSRCRTVPMRQRPARPHGPVSA